MEDKTARRVELARQLLERADVLHAQVEAAKIINRDDDIYEEEMEQAACAQPMRNVAMAMSHKVMAAKDEVKELAMKAHLAKKKLAEANDRQRKTAVAAKRRVVAKPPMREQPEDEEANLIQQCRELSISLHREQHELRALREKETALQAVLESLGPSKNAGPKSSSEASKNPPTRSRGRW
jgi:hypothetical protein